MDYIELTLDAADAEQAEILTAELADFPFESFEQEGARLKAYIPQERLADCKGEVDALLARYGVGRATFLSIEPQNWNALWESNFTPVEVDGRLTIRAPFHAPAATEAEVVIMPKMSFGTGHHATTCLMASGLLDRDVTGLRGLDMGSGTGVLAIVAALRGAETVDAVDIDEWAYENCVENIRANGVETRVTPLTAVRFHRGQHQPQYPAGAAAGLCRSARRRRLAAHERDSGSRRRSALRSGARCGLLRYGTCAARRLGTRGRREKLTNS